MPTGGITPETVTAWLGQPSVVACGGSWIATRDAVAGRRWEEIRTNAAQAAELAADAVRSHAASS
jgi:2-dehydro-3-deoxyphosphogluconate aldolase/(4S)-4-hydroxy-2-oxoglutarate aldolase